jgi:uncharacterized protein DUF5676
MTGSLQFCKECGSGNVRLIGINGSVSCSAMLKSHLQASRRSIMTIRHPLALGAASAITVAVGYALCTLAFWLFPDTAVNFMNALFHGLDFRPLKVEGAFTPGTFLYGLVVMSVWAFFLGALFGWLAQRLRQPLDLGFHPDTRSST